VQGYRKAVVTPNAMEFSRLVKTILCKDVAPSVLPDPKLVAELSAALGHVTVVHKGNTEAGVLVRKLSQLIPLS
jgi:ATP-dependent NAD(P)H-hydrate dehydratase